MWVAYLVDHVELACGCNDTRTRYIYDSTGRKKKTFDTKESALAEANKRMMAEGYDHGGAFELTKLEKAFLYS